MILVTGGTGLLGSHLLLQLTFMGFKPRALYRNEQRLIQVKKVFQYYYPDHFEEYFSAIQWLNGDILDIPSLEDALQGVTDVYHCAGLVSFASADFKKVLKVNREGTTNVVNCCLSANIRKLCHVSSTAAVGINERGLTDESFLWKNGPEVSGYSVSKYAAELEVWRGIEEGLDAVIVNPSLIFGSGNWAESSMSIFKTIDKGLLFYTPGSNSFVDARDVAQIMIDLMLSEIKNERFLCSGSNMGFKEMFTRIAQEMKKRPPIISTPRWLAALGWRIDALRACLLQKKTSITKDTVASSYKLISYDSSKITHALQYTFRSATDTIQNAIKGRIL